MKKIEMTTGSLWKNILLFSLPLMLTQLLEVLFNLSDVANFEKKFPREWINASGNNVTADFANYCLPLIQGEPKLPKEDSLPRFAKLKKVLAK